MKHICAIFTILLGSSIALDNNSPANSTVTATGIADSSSDQQIDSSSDAASDALPANQFVDKRDGHIYKTATVGTAVWMSENLAYNGIDHFSAKNKSENDSKYGYLYFWKNAQEACPEGWHLPTKAEYEELLAAAGKTEKLRRGSLSSAEWKNGNDSLGFSAIPAGVRWSSGYFDYFGNYACFWSATEEKGRAVGLGISVGTAFLNGYDKKTALSVRCVKNN